MSKNTGNRSASVRQRLYTIAKQSGRSFNELLQLYAMERFLYRLSCSPYRDRFVLKGALMLMVWDTGCNRTTRDIDLLGITGNAPENLHRITRELCVMPVQEDDGLVFDAATINAVRIKEGAEYEGVRIKFVCYLGEARIPMQIDVGFNDVVTPRPQTVNYPVLLDFPPPKLNGYTFESVIAEKFEAMVKLGAINSRMKDFYDIWFLAGQFHFDHHKLGEAITATFQRRGTLMKSPAILTPDFDDFSAKQKQWMAFVTKNELEHAPGQFTSVTRIIRQFLAPYIDRQECGTSEAKEWIPGQGWKL
ncbi:MAG: nucleotidyl transferase AbiEii/AbiGii toxin family protein [Spartobacteria bacterium]|nr:nucleotidyl transferase AbiEii/AbiGii toxin family protein [Spartobacteria bacterium]